MCDAPKDGTYILAWSDVDGAVSEQLAVVRFYTADEFREMNGCLDDTHHDWDYYEDGWWGGDGSKGPYEDLAYWVPLPPLPPVPKWLG
jgi:hypothetical protein